MTTFARVLGIFGGAPPGSRSAGSARLLSAAGRYSLSAFGPFSISAAHLVAALILLHHLPRTQFGLFSFLLVIAPFCLSLCGAMFAPPIARQRAFSTRMPEQEQLTLVKAKLAFSAAVALAIAAIMFVSGAEPIFAAIFGCYGALMSMRWFARCWSYAEGQTVRVLLSDLAYSAVLLATLLLLVESRELTMWSASLALLVSAGAALPVLDLQHLSQHFRALHKGRLAPFVDTWREMSGWAVLGVVTSEFTVNAHAYLVTLISGPHAFAVLAVGALLTRPVSLVLAALPDMERPLMAGALGTGERSRAFRIVKEFRTAAGAIWLVTIAIAAVLLTWFPFLVVKKEYALSDVLTVVAISAAIMVLRVIRTPESVLLQAAGEFRKLAGAGVWSSIVSLCATLFLLLIAGPIVSLFGILLGDIVATRRTFAIARAWRLSHG
jgi:O-antigen/teichoic acid export membrane protein